MPSSKAPRREPLRVGLLALPDLTGMALFGLFDMFHETAAIARSSDVRSIEPTIVAARAAPLRASSGLLIAPDITLERAPSFDLLVVPNIELPLGTDPHAAFSHEAAWLRERHAAGATLCSVCSGSLLLAAAGLLDGREATTHWSYVETFRRHYPAVRLRPERVLVTTGARQRIITAGGASSWQDLALYVIARYCSGELAVRMAKLYLIHWHREGQLPYASMLRELQHNDGAIRRAQDWLAERFRERNPIGAAVQSSGLSERTFKRRFREATGMTPIEYVQGLRLEYAERLLESTATAVDDIAQRVGYEDPTFFRRLFRRQKGLTPAQYRRQFAPIRHAVLATR